MGVFSDLLLISSQLGKDLAKIIGWYIAPGIAAVLGVYAIYVGFRLAHATDEGKRSDAKKHLVKVIASLFMILILTSILSIIVVTIDPVGDTNQGYSIVLCDPDSGAQVSTDNLKERDRIGLRLRVTTNGIWSYAAGTINWNILYPDKKIQTGYNDEGTQGIFSIVLIMPGEWKIGAEEIQNKTESQSYITFTVK